MRRIAIAVLCLVAAVATACSSSSDDTPKGGAVSAKGGVQLKVVSTRPDMVTGGDALVDVGHAGAAFTITADGKALQASAVGAGAGAGDYLVRGLPIGKSTLTLKVGDASDSLDVTNHPLDGPVFSGKHMPLLACATEGFGLGPSTPDKGCFAPTKVDYLYASTTKPGLQPLTNTAQRPADVKQATVDGKRVDFIVRRERGVINRAVYFIDVLDPNPAVSGPVVPAWNKRLIYRFGGGCGTTFGQGGTLASADAPEYLEQGYAVATSTFNTFQTQCNDVLSAETLMMVKEHFIEEFGVPVHTIGEGGSGGAIQQHLIVQNYPGLLDAIVASLPFPDAISIAAGVTDCGLLNRYYKTPAGAALTDKQKSAINGHAVPGTCALWERLFLEGIRPQDGCDPKIATSAIYDAKTNPDGLRCDLADANINQLGVDPATGFAYRPVDNQGLQYGLDALNDGLISPEEFVALNEAIGGYDDDGTMVASRTVAPIAGVERAYAYGRVSQGGGDQKKIPIIDINVYTDFAGDIHDRFRAFSLRDRLESPNFVIWTVGAPNVKDVGGVISNLATVGGGIAGTAISTLDTWLDTGTKPKLAVDTCQVNGKSLSGADVYESGACVQEYPTHGDPRVAAGAPQRNDILKCALKPVDPSDYKVHVTDAQRQRLQSVFPKGVCDWTKKGVGQVPLKGTWLKY